MSQRFHSIMSQTSTNHSVSQMSKSYVKRANTSLKFSGESFAQRFITLLWFITGDI